MGFRELVFFTALFSFVNWFNQVPWLAVAESYEEIDSNNLNGLYLTVISLSNPPVFLERNSSGTVVKWFGPPVEIIHQLSISFNFRYSIIPTKEITIEKLAYEERGLADYIQNGDADILIGAATIIASRFQLLDFTQPWDQGSVGILIPKRSSHEVCITTILKPFQLPIWITLLISVFTVAVALCAVKRAYSIIEACMLKISTACMSLIDLSQSIYDVLSSLLGQVVEGLRSSDKIAISLITAAWCLAISVLVNTYSSILITYLIMTKPPAIVENVHDLAQNDGLRLLVQNKGAVDTFLSKTADDKLYSKLNSKLNSYPLSRCKNVTECSQHVKESQSAAYLHGKDFLLDIIGRDFKRTGKCHLQLAKEDFSQYHVSFVLTKRSYYTEYFNRGILDLAAKGLIIHWKKLYLATGFPCLRSNNEQPKNQRLSTQNLSGAFGILLIGYSISILVFAFERISHCFFNGRHNASKHSISMVEDKYEETGNVLVVF